MPTWVLIIALMRPATGLAITSVPGFASKGACDTALGAFWVVLQKTDLNPTMVCVKQQ